MALTLRETMLAIRELLAERGEHADIETMVRTPQYFEPDDRDMYTVLLMDGRRRRVKGRDVQKMAIKLSAESSV